MRHGSPRFIGEENQFVTASIQAPRPIRITAVGAAPQTGEDETAVVPIDLLQPADSPRLAGVDERHVNVLAELDDLPPILVHRPTMRVIDGMHRLRAAQLQGRSHLSVQFFDGDDTAAFLRAVSANITHGLPLSLADRQAAAMRVVRVYPQWSDRAVARAVGLSGKTVGVLRREATEEVPQLNKRLGQDGRLRPVNGAVGRRIAGELFATRPEATLREIAAAAGISPATARDVRERLHRGDDPVTETQRQLDARSNIRGAELRLTDSHDARPLHPVRTRADRADQEPVDHLAVLGNLRRDPSLRYTDTGRNLLRWLDRHLVGRDDVSDLGDTVPPHCLPVIARLARQCANEWKALAEQLDQRMREIA
jgi:hypothetical protein